MKISNKILLSSLFDRFTKYLNDNDSIIVFKYEDNKVKYSFKGDEDHWYPWFKETPGINNNLKDERLLFFIGKQYSFFNSPFSNKYKYKVVNKCINFLLNPVSLEEISIKMDLMGI